MLAWEGGAKRRMRERKRMFVLERGESEEIGERERMSGREMGRESEVGGRKRGETRPQGERRTRQEFRCLSKASWEVRWTGTARPQVSTSERPHCHTRKQSQSFLQVQPKLASVPVSWYRRTACQYLHTGVVVPHVSTLLGIEIRVAA